MRAIQVVRTYAHPRDVVWRALTDRDALAAWLMPNDFVPELGAHFTMRTDPAPGFDGTVRCLVEAFEPPGSMTWRWQGGPLDTRVTFTLEEVPGGTRLTLVHDGFAGFSNLFPRFFLGIGWTRNLLGRTLPAWLQRQAG